MQTVNRQYPLPHKNNVVLEDLERICTAFTKIDEDIVETEDKIDDTLYIVSDLEKRAVHVATTVENSEIQKIAPNRYLKTTDDGTGFECVDGGGDEGGKTGQNSIKKSDDNYDTIWGNILEVSTKGMTVQQNAESAKPNQTYIYADDAEIENTEQLPHADLVNQQITENVFAENNESFIFREEIEQITEEFPIATRKNYGFVKIGKNIKDINGKISIEGQELTSKENFGLVMIGNGLEENDGVLSKEPIEVATTSTFGVVKLGADFAINDEGAAEVVKSGDNEMVIYDLAKMKIVSNGIVDLEENVAIYRIFLNEDLQFSFNLGFEPQSDFSFILEIISDGLHLISFNDALRPEVSPLPVNRGITRINFTKKLGASYYDVKISRLDAPEPVLLTPDYGDDVHSDLIVNHNGADWNAHEMLRNDHGDMNFWGREFNFEFVQLVVVDYVFYRQRFPDRAIGEFSLKASNDKINWVTLIYKNGEMVEGNIPTEIKGCFRYFKLKMEWLTDNYPRCFQLWGTAIDNNESELVLLTPYMNSNPTTFATLTFSNLHEGNVGNLTDSSAGSWVYVKYAIDTEADPYRWIKYEFPEAQVANFVSLAAYQDNLERSMRWYKLEGSNDNETWNLLLERQYQHDFTGREARCHSFENETSYKFYRLTCLHTNGDQYWRITDFRLWRRQGGKWNFYPGIPRLQSNGQDGYEVSASSNNDGDEGVMKAFDGDSGTRWTTTGGGAIDSWVQVKLPAAAAFNAVLLTSRGEGWVRQSPKDFKIQGSNDGEIWDDLSTQTGVTWDEKERKKFTFQNETAYLYYRIFIQSVQSDGYAALSEIDFGTAVHDYKRWLNKYDNVVPTMTSDATEGSDGTYSLSSSSEHSGHKRIYLFDRRFDTRFELNGEGSGWVQVELPVAKFVNIFAVGSRSDSWCDAAPRDYTLLGSNDGTTWTTLFSIADSASFSASELRTHELSNTESYKFYRLNIDNSNRGSVLTFARWDLIIKDLIIEY